MRTAMQQMGAAAADAGEQHRWFSIELALVLAEATGRRLGSVRLLRWEDRLGAWHDPVAR
ncbi:MAG: hypothetical protein ACJ79K_09605 [Gemmatimonadaceae bacterium]